jgi:leucyl/phenylalanyl-tRNA---protein transferase
MITWLSPDDPPERFPPHETALRDPPGLLAAGGDLKFERLIAAYERGIFPWYSPGQPVLWWSPDPREVLLPRDFHRSRRLRRTLRQQRFATHLDRDFGATIRACAAPRRSGADTWLNPQMIGAYEAHARARHRAFDRDVPGRCPRRRTLWPAARRRVFRRIDVQPRHGRLESGHGAPGR